MHWKEKRAALSPLAFSKGHTVDLKDGYITPMSLDVVHKCLDATQDSLTANNIDDDHVYNNPCSALKCCQLEQQTHFKIIPSVFPPLLQICQFEERKYC